MLNVKREEKSYKRRGDFKKDFVNQSKRLREGGNVTPPLTILISRFLETSTTRHTKIQKKIENIHCTVETRRVLNLILRILNKLRK